MAGDIGAHIGERVLQRMPHPGLRRQMDDPVDPGTVARRREPAALGDIEAMEGESQTLHVLARNPVAVEGRARLRG